MGMKRSRVCALWDFFSLTCDLLIGTVSSLAVVFSQGLRSGHWCWCLLLWVLVGVQLWLSEYWTFSVRSIAKVPFKRMSAERRTISGRGVERSRSFLPVFRRPPRVRCAEEVPRSA